VNQRSSSSGFHDSIGYWEQRALAANKTASSAGSSWSDQFLDAAPADARIYRKAAIGVALF
jgi:hypothetical protein